MRRTTIMLAVFLAACATNKHPWHWQKDGATEDQFAHDQLQCRQYAMQSAQANGLTGNMFIELWVRPETEKCLGSLGYQRVAD